jgi:hypothetical protein
MKFLRLDLLTLLISLFILGSCKNQNDIGLPIGGDQLNGTLLVYDDIVIKTDSDNTPISVGTAKTPLSSLNDPELGVTEANIATGLNLPSSAAFTVPTGTVTTDSVVMELRYTDGFYGDSVNSKYKVNVYQLDEKPSSNQTYYSNKVWKVKMPLTALNDPAKAGAFNARPKTGVRVSQIVKGGRDTLKIITPHLRVALNKTFIPNILFNTPTAVGSNTAFQNAVNGLYLNLQRNQPSETGGTLMFNLDSSRISVYYRVVNNGVTDTAIAVLPFSTHAAEVKPRFNSYPSAVKSAIDPSTGSNNVFYIQGLAGLRAKISFPNLKSIFGAADLNTIAINRAELVITPKPGTDLPPFVAQPQLTMYRLDIAKQRALLPDANGSSQGALDPRFFGTAAFGGNYLAAKKEYHFVVTGYIQDLLRGRLTDYGTYIAAIDTVNRINTVDIAPTIQTAGRLIAVGTDKSPQRIRLNVIYTKNN